MKILGITFWLTVANVAMYFEFKVQTPHHLQNPPLSICSNAYNPVILFHVYFKLVELLLVKLNFALSFKLCSLL